MLNLSWHDYLLILSFFASVAGIILLMLDRHSVKNEVEAADSMLLLMAFVYWGVYCSANGLQRVVSPDLETFLLSIKLTGVISYLLTASCVLSLPLNRLSIKQVE